MAKAKSDKSFMSISRKDCLVAYKVIQENALVKFDDSIILAERGSYGSATSLLIHSMEENMKAFVLFMDGKGFDFRKKTKGISNLFDNHTLRYPLAMALSVITIFGFDIINKFSEIKVNPQSILKFSKDKDGLLLLFKDYMANRMLTIMDEIVWFSQAEKYRQDGFYTDYIDQLRTPLSATKQDYEDVKYRIGNLQIFLKGFFESFDIQDEKHQEQIESIRKSFDTEDATGKTIYKHLSEKIEEFRDKEIDAFSIMKAFIGDIHSELNSETK